jgi:hypothetical protein
MEGAKAPSSCEHLPLPNEDGPGLRAPDSGAEGKMRRSVSWGDLTVHRYELTPEDIESKRKKSMPIAITYEPCESAMQLQVPPSKL